MAKAAMTCLACGAAGDFGVVKTDVIRDDSRPGPLNLLECMACNFTIIYTGDDHAIPCHHCGVDTTAMPRLYDFR